MQKQRRKKMIIISIFKKRSPINPKAVITKRIVALPGDTIQPLRKKNETVSVPEGHCWIEGDEAFHSRDSNSFGTVKYIIIIIKQTKIHSNSIILGTYWIDQC
jgi:signal peptidase I